MSSPIVMSPKKSYLQDNDLKIMIKIMIKELKVDRNKQWNEECKNAKK